MKEEGTTSLDLDTAVAAVVDVLEEAVYIINVNKYVIMLLNIINSL